MVKSIALIMLLCWCSSEAYAAFNISHFNSGTFSVTKVTTTTVTTTTKFKK